VYKKDNLFLKMLRAMLQGATAGAVLGLGISSLIIFGAKQGYKMKEDEINAEKKLSSKNTP
jgi:hypothetical protein